MTPGTVRETAERLAHHISCRTCAKEVVAKEIESALLAERAKERERCAQMLAILNRSFHAGSRVTNCVVHASLDFDHRPDGCKLCLADIKNHLALALRINYFLNEVKDEAIRALSSASENPKP